MNNIKALCCNQYFELKSNGDYNGKDSTRNFVTKMITVSFIFLLFGVFFTLIQFDVFREPYYKLMKDLFGRMGKNNSGKILAIIVIMVAYIVARVIVRKSWYDYTIEEFEMYTEDEQKEISEKGFNYFIFSMCFMALPVVVAVVRVL